MATRPCLRCSKLVPETAAFCRRCGHSLIQKSSPVTAVEASAPTAPLPLSPRARPFPLSVASWPGLIVTTAAGAIAAVLGLFAASLPPVESAPSDPGPPRVESLDTDAGARQLARMSERLAEARGRLGAARERVASARERWDWRAKGEAPQLLSTDRADGPAASVPPRPRPRFSPPDVPKTSASPQPVPWPGRPETMADVARANVLRPDAPRITGFSNTRGAAGARVAVDGRGFAGTSRVVFAAPLDAGAGAAWRDADFRVSDDGRLIVTIPDLGPRQRPATILVVTPRGAAMLTSSLFALTSVNGATKGTSGDEALYFVAAGATLSPPRGAVVVVDRGASVRSAAGSLLVVRAGGGVEQARADCLIIRETPRPQARDLAAVPVLDVPAINTCFIDPAFRYTGRPSGR